MSTSILENSKKLTAILAVASVCVLITMFMGPEQFNGLDVDETFVERLLNRVYFVMTTLSTVGYGDISPRSSLAKIVGISIMGTMLATVVL